jgi:tetratricopeptide (TPR) repeat protein
MRAERSPDGSVVSWAAWACLALAALCGAGSPVLAASADLADDEGTDVEVVPVRKLTELNKDGTIYRGRRQPPSDPAKIKITDPNTGITYEFDKAELRSILEETTAEQSAVQTFKNYPTRPAGAARALLRFYKSNSDLEAAIRRELERVAGTGDVNAMPLLIELLLAKGDTPAAEKFARDLVRRQKNARACRLLGQALGAQPEKAKEADEAFTKALELAPDDEKVMVAAAEFMLAAGRPQDARKIFEDALARNPRSIPALTGQGYVLLRQGELLPAVDSFLKAIDLDKEDARAQGVDRIPVRAYIGLAAAKALNKDHGEAYDLARKVLLRETNHAQAFGLQAYCRLMQAGETEPQALGQIENALQADPREPRFKILKAVVLQRAGAVLDALSKPQEAKAKYEEAAKQLSEVAEANAPDPWVQYLLAQMRYEQGLHEEALAGFKRAAELNPGYAPAHQAAGAAALALQKWAEAEAAYKKALELDNGKADYQAGLGLAMLGRGLIVEARQVLDKAKQMDPNNVPALCGLGYIANAEKNEEKVKEHFHRALAADGTCQYAASALKAYYAFRGLRMDYITFDSDQLPARWIIRGTGGLKPTVTGNQLAWRGKQGATASVKYEFLTDLKADDFVRLEADLDIQPDCAAAFALRLCSSAGGGIVWEFALGKNDTNQIAYMLRDGNGVRDWTPIAPWPASGKVRLAIHTKDLAAGSLTVYVNGDDKGSLQLKLSRPTRMAAGVYLQCPARTEVEAFADNVVLLSRLAEAEVAEPTHGELIPVEKKSGEPEKKAAEPEKKAGEPEKKGAEPEKKAGEPEKKAAPGELIPPEKKADAPAKKAGPGELVPPEKKAMEASAK